MKYPMTLAVLMASNVAMADKADCDCQANQAEIKSLTQRIEQLEKKFAEVAKKTTGDSGPKTPSLEERQRLARLYDEAHELKNEGNAKAALAKFKEIIEINPQIERRINSDIKELEVMGKAISAKLDVSKWLNQQRAGQKINLSKGVTFVVFWELWCPHCKRSIPELSQLYTELKGQGLQMVGLTTLSRKKTAKEVSAFIDAEKVSYPIASHDGKLNAVFSVAGIPAAAVVKDGVIVWRGHPASADDVLLNRFLKP